MLHEPFSFRLMEINSKCAAVFQSLDLLPVEMEQIFVQFDQFLKEKIYPISKAIDAFLSTVRECAQIARESARSCAIFSQWSREFGDQLQLQPNWELMFYKVQDLQSRFRENGLSKHWLPPSLSPLLQVLIFEHRNRIEEQKRQEREASEALAQATRKIVELEKALNGTKLDDDGKQKPEVPRIELPTTKNTIEEKLQTPLQSAHSSRASARRQRGPAAISDDEASHPHNDTPKTPPPSVGGMERNKIAVVKRQIEHDEDEPWGDKAEMEEPLGDKVEMEEPWGDKVEMEEPWGDKAEMEEPLGDKVEMEEPWGDKAEMEEPWGDKAEQQTSPGKIMYDDVVEHGRHNKLNKKQNGLMKKQNELKKEQNELKKEQNGLKKKDQNELKSDQNELKKAQNELKKDQNGLKMNMKLSMRTLDERRHQQRSARSSLSRKIDGEEAGFSNVPRRNSENFEQNAKNKMPKLNLAKQNGDEARDGGFVTVREAKLTNEPEADDVKEFEWIERMVKRADGIKLHGVEMKQDEEPHPEEGKEETHPDETEKEIHPEEGMEETHPEEGMGETHPDETEKEIHPEEGMEETHPDETEKEIHPEETEKEIDLGEGNPEDGKEETHPDETEKEIHPEEGMEVTHPDKTVKETYPEEGKEETHPDETEKEIHPEETEKETDPEEGNSKDGKEETHPEEGKEKTHPDEWHPEEGKVEIYPEEGKEKTYPEEEKEETYPRERKEETNPEERKEEAHPEEGNEETHPEERKEEAHPEEGKEEAQPEEEKKETHPEEGKEETHPEEGKEEAQPEEGKEETHPEEGKEESHAEEEKEETHPEEEKEETHPEERKEETHPEERKEEAHPEEGKQEAHPEEGKQEAHPEEGKQEAHPEKGREETHPEERKEEAHPDERITDKAEADEHHEMPVGDSNVRAEDAAARILQHQWRKRMNPRDAEGVLEQAGDELESSAAVGAVVPESNSGNAHEFSQPTVLEFWELFRNLADLLEVEVPSRAHVLSRPESAGEREARQRAMAAIMDRLKNVLDELRRIGGAKRKKRVPLKKQSKSVEANEIGQSDL
uniref:Uncharacterized protein n=1 Tax=Globodera rostochiensis TaxID=31243 RepID=A0A914H197_GLORO